MNVLEAEEFNVTLCNDICCLYSFSFRHISSQTRKLSYSDNQLLHHMSPTHASTEVCIVYWSSVLPHFATGMCSYWATQSNASVQPSTDQSHRCVSVLHYV